MVEGSQGSHGSIRGGGDNDYLTDGYSLENNLQVDELIAGGDRDTPTPQFRSLSLCLSLSLSCSFSLINWMNFPPSKRL